MPEAPTILDGMRGTRSARADAARNVPKPEKVLPPGEGICYLSKYERYRCQITSPTQTLSTDGRIHREVPVVVQFEAGMFRNNEKDPKKRKEIDRILQESPNFGLGRMFWLASDDAEDRRQRTAKQAAYLIQHDPALQAEIEKQVTLRLGKSEDLPSASA